MRYSFIFLIILSSLCDNIFAQSEYIYSKNGTPILNRRQLVFNCLRALHKDRYDKAAVAICECQTDKLDKQFTNKQYRKHTYNNFIDINNLVKEDSLINKLVKECFTNSGNSILLQAEGFETEFISNCIKNVQSSTEKKLDINKLTSFCNCQLDLVKKNKISDAEMRTMQNPNSLLFFEIMYKCGNPFGEESTVEKNWNPNIEKDIIGPSIDTVKVLNLNGMTYLKLKTGSLIEIWLFDTGATDLLINTDMEKQLKLENIIAEANYIGMGEYEMANGIIDSCKKYKINSIEVGKFIVNNVVIAVSEKGKRIIVGKALLNKFSSWTLNNKENRLILNK
jgi:hypothetical protein